MRSKNLLPQHTRKQPAVLVKTVVCKDAMQMYSRKHAHMAYVEDHDRMGMGGTVKHNNSGRYSAVSIGEGGQGARGGLVAFPHRSLIYEHVECIL